MGPGSPRAPVDVRESDELSRWRCVDDLLILELLLEQMEEAASTTMRTDDAILLHGLTC